MSKASNPLKTTNPAGEVDPVFAWREHMYNELCKNDRYRGCTVLLRRKGKAYVFRIPGFNNPVSESKTS